MKIETHKHNQLPNEYDVSIKVQSKHERSREGYEIYNVDVYAMEGCESDDNLSSLSDDSGHHRDSQTFDNYPNYEHSSHNVNYQQENTWSDHHHPFR